MMNFSLKHQNSCQQDLLAMLDCIFSMFLRSLLQRQALLPALAAQLPTQLAGGSTIAPIHLVAPRWGH